MTTITPEMAAEIEQTSQGLLTTIRNLGALLDVAPKDGRISLEEWKAFADKSDIVRQAMASGTACSTGRGNVYDTWMGRVMARLPMVASESFRDWMESEKHEDRGYDKATSDRLWTIYKESYKKALEAAAVEGLPSVEGPENFGERVCALSGVHQGKRGR